MYHPPVPSELGSVKLTPTGTFEAGSYATFTLAYTAGPYGVDDLGGIKVCFRFACDQSPPQVADPRGAGFCTAHTSTGVPVHLSYDPRGSPRPWYKTILARLVGGGLNPGDTLVIKIGDTTQGSPGLRVQTFCEDPFVFQTHIDAFSTNTYVQLPSPSIAIVSGPPSRWVAAIPTIVNPGEKFRLSVKAEDRWGNPSDQVTGTVRLIAKSPVEGLPPTLDFTPGIFARVIEDLVVQEEGTVTITIQSTSGKLLTRTNSMVISAGLSLHQYWGDLHGQSGETIGSNTAPEYFNFTRDRAFLDVTAHQGNDFQVTRQFWGDLNEIVEELNETGRFVTIAGYEWSGNTANGGDRNIYFKKPHATIHRSSHVLIADEDLDTDCQTASDLFSMLVDENGAENVVVFPHVGGRYADLLNHHDGRIEHSVEIHSAWGTFEWLLFDAFEKGYRVGVVANSDDHKGRPGASYPGASKFGAMGGLTCFLVPQLSRDAIFEALKRRHHYATTGTRLFLDVRINLTGEGILYHRDPAVFGPGVETSTVSTVIMGDIVGTGAKDVTLEVKIVAGSPIERVEIFDGPTARETVRPFSGDTGKWDRIRVVWEGAEYRARNRNASWKGTLQFSDNTIHRAESFNFWNIDAPLQRTSPHSLAWNTMTSGNFQGIDLWLANPRGGTLSFQSNQVTFDLPLTGLSHDEKIYPAGGLGKQVRVFRLPSEKNHTSCAFSKSIHLNRGRDTRVFVKVTLEDGHQAWSSPIYLIPPLE